jgi:hypothetical protein
LGVGNKDLAESSKEGDGSKTTVLPMMMTMMMGLLSFPSALQLFA